MRQNISDTDKWLTLKWSLFMTEHLIASLRGTPVQYILHMVTMSPEGVFPHKLNKWINTNWMYSEEHTYHDLQISFCRSSWLFNDFQKPDLKVPRSSHKEAKSNLILSMMHKNHQVDVIHLPKWKSDTFYAVYNMCFGKIPDFNRMFWKILL